MQETPTTCSPLFQLIDGQGQAHSLSLIRKWQPAGETSKEVHIQDQ